MLLIGTNNLSATANFPGSTPEQTVEGIQAICAMIAARSPQSHILLMGVFPRGGPQDSVRDAIRRINEQLATSAAGRPGITFLDIGERSLDSSGRILVSLIDDGAHPTAAGYRVWAEAIEPIVRRYVP